MHDLAPPTGPRILVLHSHADSAPAADLKRELHLRGAEVISHDRLSKDRPWTAALAREIASSDLVLVLLSSEEHSRDLLYEVEQAWASRGPERVVIVVLSRENTHPLPSDLAGLMYLKMSGGGIPAFHVATQ